MPAVLEKDRFLIVERLGQIAQEDQRIIAAFLGGSLAADQFVDEYSDIDIYYVVKPEHNKGLHSNMRSLIEKIGPLVYFDQHSQFGFDMSLFMFENGVKGEIGLGPIDKIRVMHVGPFKVLVDKAGVMKEVTLPIEKAPEGEDLRKYVESQLRWYWYWHNILLTTLGRDHLWGAQQALNMMRGYAWPLLKVANGVNPSDRIERHLSRKLRDEMGGTLAAYDKESMRVAAETMTRILKRETKQLIEKTGAEYPTKFERRVLSK